MKQTILSLMCLVIVSIVSAQNQGTFKCGSDNYYQQHLDNHPEVVTERAEFEVYLAIYAQSYNPEAKSAGINIPVVFHVNDPSNPQKVTMAQIESALTILNEDFTATTTVVMDQNYMDYTPSSMYSLGQKTRVIAALNSTLAGRSNLWTNANLIATGCASNVGINDLSVLELTNIFPNPASTEIHFEFNQSFQEEITIRITNALGQEVKVLDITTAEVNTLNIADLPNGIYVIAIETLNASIVKRIVKSE